ncbi:MAG: peptidoglycan-binding domain-containing protein [Eubacterium sp.]
MDSDSDRNDVDVSESNPEQNTVQSEEGNTEENWNPDSVQTEEIQQETEIEEAQVEQPEIEEAQTEETQEPAEEEEISQQDSSGTLTMKSVTKAAAASYTPISYTPKYTNPIQNTISGVSFSTVRDKTIQIIGINEGDYVTVVKDDNGALSIGKMQWHATRALNLLKTIASANSQQAYELLGEKLYEEIRTSSGWGTRIINDDEKNKIKALLATAESKAAQDKLAVSDVNVYINHGLMLKIANPAALVYFADVENQWGAGGSAKCVQYAANLVGKDYSKITLNEMHLGTVCYTYTRGGYYNRRQNTYNKAVDLGWVYCHSGDLRITSVQWLQKSLNAYQNAGLTVDGSYGEATKNAVRKFQESSGIGVDGSAGTTDLLYTDL